MEPVTSNRNKWRVGMDKNTRTGRIKYVTSHRTESDRHVLVEVSETCFDGSGSKYVAKYNLWLVAKKDSPIRIDVSRNDVGRFVKVGFYIQSFRNKDIDHDYVTILTLKHLEFLDNEEQMLIVSEGLNK